MNTRRMVCCALAVSALGLGLGGEGGPGARAENSSSSSNSNSATGSGSSSSSSRSSRRTGYSDTRQRNNRPIYRYNRTPYALTPFSLARATTNNSMIILSPTRPYTDEEYSRIVLSTLSIADIEPASARLYSPSIIEEIITPEGIRQYKMAETSITDVLDRGIVMTGSGEEVKLRGARISSERDPDDVMRYYAREAMRAIRRAAADQPVTVQFDEPLRNRDGAVLGIFKASDGTRLNLLLLEQGLARLEPGDFFKDDNIELYEKAEKDARVAHRGMWSHIDRKKN
ncbi:MAG: thermonuclease family protein [bacterium]